MVWLTNVQKSPWLTDVWLTNVRLTNVRLTNVRLTNVRLTVVLVPRFYIGIELLFETEILALHNRVSKYIKRQTKQND